MQAPAALRPPARHRVATAAAAIAGESFRQAVGNGGVEGKIRIKIVIERAVGRQNRNERVR